MIIILGLSVLSGILGRMGGVGKPYRSWVRDWVCSFLIVVGLWYLFGFKFSGIGVYLVSYILMSLSLTTYWDWIFGEDNLWFSGLIAGASMFPVLFIDITFVLFFLRTVILCLTWGILNKYLPEKIIIWRRDVVEEFLRYFVLVFTVLLLKIGS